MSHAGLVMLLTNHKNHNENKERAKAQKEQLGLCGASAKSDEKNETDPKENPRWNHERQKVFKAINPRSQDESHELANQCTSANWVPT